MGGVAYFAANDGIHGEELWRSDGTVSGTYMVKDVNPWYRIINVIHRRMDEVHCLHDCVLHMVLL